VSVFHKYLLGGDTMAPSGLYAKLCHAFLVYVMIFCSFCCMAVNSVDKLQFLLRDAMLVQYMPSSSCVCVHVTLMVLYQNG